MRVFPRVVVKKREKNKRKDEKERKRKKFSTAC